MENTVATNVPTAKLSPRIENDKSIRWYAGDTFKLTLQILLHPSTDETVQSIIPLEDGDTVLCTFKRSDKTIAHEFAFTEFEDNSVTMDFNADVTAKFPKGNYTYDITHIRDYRRTIAKSNSAIVE